MIKKFFQNFLKWLRLYTNTHDLLSDFEDFFFVVQAMSLS